MKIKSIDVVQISFPQREMKTKPRRPSWGETDEVANPMSRYPKVKRHRGLWLPKWDGAWVRVTAENGVYGLGTLWPARPLIPVIEHFASQMVGDDCLATEKFADMCFRMTKAYGTTGLASYAISGLDLALWDLKGKIFGKPVYSLLGGPTKDKMYCYATGNDVDWYKELGYTAFKLACPYGPADGMDGIRKNEEFVAQARDRIGPASELMLDCWMAFDVEYTVRLAEALRPYKLKWMEECLIPEDLDAHLEVRERLPWQTLATGEHWYTTVPFEWATRHKAVDILQPDIAWCGGVTACQKICGGADAAGISVILHGGGNSIFGQHFSFGMPNIPWMETFVGTPPGVPLEEAWVMPGQAVPKNGWLVPNDAPGFGMEFKEDWIKPY
jgi:L-rhamnonate dehydratase